VGAVEEMTRPELRVALDWFCGCGDPAGAAKAVLEILDLHPLYEHWGEFKEMVPGEESVRYVLLYALDQVTSDTRFDVKREGWFEHGSSIGGQWLTPEGERVRDALRREFDLGPDDDGDHFGALFDEPSCIHGYAPGDPGYEDHDCMAEEKPTYTFPVCVTCGMEIDESNEHKHRGEGHDIKRLKLAEVDQ
jgi:hypothetical protein